jgi:hypothetical protein
VGDSGCEGGGAHEVGGFAIVDLYRSFSLAFFIHLSFEITDSTIQVTYVSETDVLDKRRVDLALRDDFLEEGVDEVVEVCVLETALAGLCEGRAEREGDDDIIGVFLCTTFC